MVHQVEFLLRGNLLPPLISKLQVSERLIIENVLGPIEFSIPRESDSFAIAYVGLEDESHFFLDATTYIDFFLLIHALTHNIVVTHYKGIAFEISTLNDLGKKKVSFRKFEKVNILKEDLQCELSKIILLTKERFLEFEKDTEKIMGEYLGLALRYHFFALQAYNRRHFDEVVLNLVIAAEALFSTGKSHKYNLKRRFSNFIANDETEIYEIEKTISNFYDLRSAIVNGGKKKITFNDVKIPSIYIQKAIEKSLSSRLYLKEELLKVTDIESE